VSSAARVQGARLAGEPAQALELALGVWQEARAPVVADAVALLDAEAASVYAGYRGQARVHFHKAWLTLARGSPGALAVGWLARTLTYALPPDGGNRFQYMRLETQAFLERLEALRALRPDPRLAFALARFLRERPLFAQGQSSVERMYGGALEVMVQMEDVRQLALCDELLEEDAAFGNDVLRHLQAQLPEARARLAAVPWTEPADAELWAAMRPQDVLPYDPTSGEELLAAIYADPEDDGARLVYADWLQERGDPHGEFITLQTRPPDELTCKRALHLLRLHKYDWLGPDLSEVLYNVEFERGFLHSALVEQNARASRENWAKAVLDPRLGTLHTLGKGRASAEHYLSLLRSPHALGLRRIELPRVQVLEALLEAPLLERRRFHQLDLSFVLREPMLDRLAELPAFSELNCLFYRLSPSSLAALLDELEQSALPSGVTLGLAFPRGELDLGACWARLRERFRTLLVDHDGAVLKVRREGKGTVLECPAAVPRGHVWQAALPVVWGLREGLGPEEEITVRGMSADEMGRFLQHDIGRGLSVTFEP
jgi:uncharacterized protein (TIGR02996 family)